MNGKITTPLSHREKRRAESVLDKDGLVRPGAPANHRRKAPLYAIRVHGLDDREFGWYRGILRPICGRRIIFLQRNEISDEN